ncbi:MAG: alpha/beta hydrolase [Opitutales bacterium]
MAFIQCDFFSEVLRMGTTMNVILPEPARGQIGMGGTSGVPEHGFPTLYLLHGLSDDQTTWSRRTSIERYVSGLGLAVVMPTTHRGFYVNMASGPRYFDFFRDELPDITRRLFRLSSRREDTFVAGLSMGGFGAMYLALQNPERYAAAASLSGVVDMPRRMREPNTGVAPVEEWERLFGPNLDGLDETQYDLIATAKQLHTGGTTMPALYACCGTEDFLIDHNRSFRDGLATAGVPLTYEEAPGEHNWAFWDAWVQRVLDWLPLARRRPAS